MLPNILGLDYSSMCQNSVLGHSVMHQRNDWTTKQPQDWTQKDVLDWIYFVVEEEELDGSKFQGEVYRDFSGSDLCQMDRRQFQRADPCHGLKIYESFQNLLYRVFLQKLKPEIDNIFPENFLKVKDSSSASVDRNNNRRQPGSGRDGQLTNSVGNTECNLKSNNGMVVFKSGNDITVGLPSLGVYPIGQEFDLPTTTHQCFSTSHLQEFNSLKLPSYHSSITSFLASLTYPTVSQEPSSGSRTKRSFSSPSSFPSSSYSSTLSSLPMSLSSSTPDSLSSLSQDSPSQMLTVDTYDNGYSSEDSLLNASFMPPLDGSPKIDSFVSDFSDMGIKDSRKNGSPLSRSAETSMSVCSRRNNIPVKHGIHLWQFVLGLLQDPTSNPQYLKWEDKNLGVFRIIQSDKVAKLWGEKKNNPYMTYEKFSRAMRFCRKSGFFKSIPTTGRFPKKLCFMFGEKSHGWKE
uniref:ETS domain-containing protein n=1 Tax=Arion vulgaris TaxID=1028688 RepID=A0A0B7AE58_9EUPU